MMHGLETVVMNTRVLNLLYTFPVKCLRNILKIPTTYINREFSNAVVRQKVNEQLKSANAKPLVTLSEFHLKRHDLNTYVNS